jgi:hypothetical protein
MLVVARCSNSNTGGLMDDADVLGQQAQGRQVCIPVILLQQLYQPGMYSLLTQLLLCLLLCRYPGTARARGAAPCVHMPGRARCKCRQGLHQASAAALPQRSSCKRRVAGMSHKEHSCAAAKLSSTAHLHRRFATLQHGTQVIWFRTSASTHAQHWAHPGGHVVRCLATSQCVSLPAAC